MEGYIWRDLYDLTIRTNPYIGKRGLAYYVVARPAKREGIQLSQSISGGRKLRVCVVVATEADARGSPLGPISDSKSFVGRGNVAAGAPSVKTGAGGTSVDVDVDTGTTESTVVPVGTPWGGTGTAVTACARKRETKRMRAAGDMRAMVFWCMGGFEGDMRLERGYDKESGSGMRSVFYTSYPTALLGGLWMPIQLQKLGLTPPRTAKPSHGKWRPRNPATGTARIAREPQRLSASWNSNTHTHPRYRRTSQRRSCAVPTRPMFECREGRKYNE